MSYWRATWPTETVSPKMHILEEHVVPFIRKWKLGLGFYGEQGNNNKFLVNNKWVYQNISTGYQRMGRGRVQNVNILSHARGSTSVLHMRGFSYSVLGLRWRKHPQSVQETAQWVQLHFRSPDEVTVYAEATPSEGVPWMSIEWTETGNKGGRYKKSKKLWRKWKLRSPFPI